MLLKSVRLSNIRSYKDATVDFPSGSVLLSGDIGAGKSTVLIAVEFALFGIKRGELSGDALLRHGAKEGFVELCMSVGEKEVVVRRTLKMAGGTNNDVRQDSGFIIVDGIKTEATAVELKARVIDILGYPKEVLTKSKDLIYRFTVYTPQEEMKTILYEDAELRLDTLRKIFGIDKYKRIKENAGNYMRELRIKAREYEAKTYGLDEKKKALAQQEESIKGLAEELRQLMPRLERAKKELAEKKEKLKEKEAVIKELSRVRSELKIIDTMFMERHLAIRRSNEEIERQKLQIARINKEIGGKSLDIKKIEERIVQLQKKSTGLEEGIESCNKIINGADVRIMHSNEIKRNILKLDICPTCEQRVEGTHKKGVEEREDAVIKDFSYKKAESQEKKKALSLELGSLRNELEGLQKDHRSAFVNAEKRKAIADLELRINRLLQEAAGIKKEIGVMNTKKRALTEKEAGLKGSEEEYEKDKKNLDDYAAGEKSLDIERTRLETMIREGEKSVRLYKAEISEKELLRQNVLKIAALRNWLEEYFVALMGLMERQIMAHLHREFNDLFRDWFRILIPDESINVRLDDEFRPVIEQDGYETELTNMSGGEKTSVALAYRLSLNKVINDFISHIMTRDIIMLDEPTDGFSDEQLDKVREVLEQINAKQVIIVSHEAKIEGFVDSIIRIEKTDHKSMVSA